MEDEKQMEKFQGHHIIRKLNFIDSKNEKNLQFASEYVNEIIVDLKKNENINRPKPHGLEETQTLVNDSCRSLVVDWLVDVSMQYKLSDDSLFLAVNIMDRYIGERKIQTKDFQLVGCGALLIASKFEEIYPPEVRDFCYIMDNAFTGSNLLRMEYEILKTLNFDVLCVSPLVFLKRFHNVSQGAYKSLVLAQFVLEISLLEIKSLNYPPSLLASSSLYISRKLVQCSDELWTEDLEFYTGYSVDDMEDCIVLLYRILTCVPNVSLAASRKKYSDKKYLGVSKECCQNKKL